MEIKPKSLFLILMDIILLCLLSITGKDMVFIISLIVWLHMLVFCLQDIENRSILLGFLLSFFVFLMGRQVLEVFDLHEIETSFSLEIEKQTNLMMFYSIIGLFLGYICIGESKRKSSNGSISYKMIQKEKQYNVISKYCFLFTYIFRLITVFETILFVKSNGYYESYVSFASRLPSIVNRLSAMNFIFLCIFLGTLPTKKEAKLPIILYVIYLVATLFTGHRFECIGGMLSIALYCVLRNKYGKKNEKWVSKKAYFGIALLALGMIAISNIIGLTRIGNSSTTSSENFFTSFIYQQGVSIKVIKRYLEYRNLLPDGKIYFLGSSLSTLSTSALGRMLSMPVYGGNSIETAENGYYFAHALSYLTMGKQYLEGAGMGSSYIAEIHYSFGNIGVFFSSVFYGILLRRIFEFKAGHTWKNAVIMIMLSTILFAPRGSFDGFLSEIIPINTWICFVVVYLFSKLSFRRS